MPLARMRLLSQALPLCSPMLPASRLVGAFVHCNILVFAKWPHVYEIEVRAHSETLLSFRVLVARDAGVMDELARAQGRWRRKLNGEAFPVLERWLKRSSRYHAAVVPIG